MTTRISTPPISATDCRRLYRPFRGRYQVDISLSPRKVRGPQDVDIMGPTPRLVLETPVTSTLVRHITSHWVVTKFVSDSMQNPEGMHHE